MGSPRVITKFPRLEEIEHFTGFQPLGKRITELKVETDFIALTQKPDYANDPRWKDENQRISYLEESKLKLLRPFQLRAVHRIQEEVHKGKDRFLFEMATGTGKTYTAFQIIWRLWKAKAKKRILFLADRNALIQQTRNGDFKHFKDSMTVVQKHQVNKAYQVYLALYQGLTGTDDSRNIFKQFSRDFFDLIVVDECHRGSARDDSAWREILEYFGSATQIGLTATPKETDATSNSDYFGNPIYTYSLKQGIDDGFLAPYRVVRITLDIDAEGWRPPRGYKDKDGYIVEDRIYRTCLQFKPDSSLI